MKTSIIYLLCFDEPYKHAKHYLGSTSDLDKCIEEHENGAHCNLTKVIKKAGISFTLARLWSGDKKEERRIKNMGGLRRVCPLCKHGD